MALFGRGNDAPPVYAEPQDPKWVRASSGHFHRLVHIDPEEEGLSRASGVYVIWHSGVKPGWVYAGRSNDLATALHEAGNSDDIMSYEVHGGLFVTWALVKDEFQNGVLKYLTDTMRPHIANPAAAKIDDYPVPVLPPGSTG